jgi:hypothetical protein
MAKHWPIVGVGALVMVVGYGLWLCVKMPHLINPWVVMKSIEAGALTESRTSMMAAMLPVVMATLLVFVLVVVLLWFVSFRNEYRLIRLIRKMEVDSENREAKVLNQASVAQLEDG